MKRVNTKAGEELLSKRRCSLKLQEDIKKGKVLVDYQQDTPDSVIHQLWESVGSDLPWDTVS